MIVASITDTWNRFTEVVDLRLVMWCVASTTAVVATAVLLRRFAKGRLVTKCIVWSILTHLILGSLLHDPNKRMPQGNSNDPRDKGPPSIRVTLASEPAAKSPTQTAPIAGTAQSDPQPWEMVESPSELTIATASPLRQAQDAAEIVATKPPVEPITVPRIEPKVSSTPWKSAKPKDTPANRIARAPAAAHGLFMPPEPKAKDSAPLSPAPTSPKRLDIDEHVADLKVPTPNANREPTTEVAPNLMAEAPSPSATSSLGTSERAVAPEQKLLLDENGNPTSIMNLVKRSPAPTRPDGEAVPEILSLRMASHSSDLARQFGATEESERAIELALAWLARNQSPDGRWDADRFGAGRETKLLEHDRQGAGAKADAAMTGLALLAFLGNGQTHVTGRYAANVRKGLDYLRQIQGADGNLAGEAEYFAKMYSHGMATIAVGEALAMSGDDSLKPMLQRAARYTLLMQHPRYGGWRYAAPQQKFDDLGDMSQFGWQVMALKSASLSGLNPPERSRQGMLTFMKSVAAGKHAGQARYYPAPGEKPSRTMSAEAACCRFFLGVDETEAQRQECTDFLLEQIPGEGQVDFYYWYYGTLALFQRQGEPWKVWNGALQEQLLDRQSSSGEFAGSWDPDKLWGNHGGRVYSTALGALCLEVYYRYLPVYHSAQESTAAGATTSPR